MLTAAVLPLLVPAWLLVMARAASLVLLAPVFSNVAIPDLVRIVLVIALAGLMFPSALATLPADLTLGGALAGLGGEILIGMVFGLAAGVVFFGADLAGQLIAQSAGFSLGEIINPQFDSESSVLQQVWFYAALLVFLTAGGAHVAVTVLLDSVHALPPLTLFAPGRTSAAGALADFVPAVLALTYDLALRLAGPSLLAVLLATLAIGFVARTAPQLNVYTIGFTIKVPLAILLIAVSLPRSAGVMTDVMHEGMGFVRDFMAAVGGRVTRGG